MREDCEAVLFVTGLLCSNPTNVDKFQFLGQRDTGSLNASVLE